jgi:hypothetical protein
VEDEEYIELESFCIDVTVINQRINSQINLVLTSLFFAKCLGLDWAEARKTMIPVVV